MSSERTQNPAAPSDESSASLTTPPQNAGSIFIPPSYFVFLFNRGRAFADVGQHKEAIKCYKEALTLNSNQVEVYFNMGNAFLNLKEYSKAIECYTEALKINPTLSKAYHYQGFAFFNLGETSKALECYKEAVRLNPNFLDSYNNIGNILADSGEHQKALEYYGEAIRRGLKHADLYFNKGNTHYYIEEYQKAMECYNEAIKLDPTHAVAYNNKGNIFCKLKDTSEAFKCYEEAIKLDPNYAEAYFNMGNILFDRGEYQQAIACYEKTLEIDPQNELASAGKDEALAALKQESTEALTINQLTLSSLDDAEQDDLILQEIGTEDSSNLGCSSTIPIVFFGAAETTEASASPQQDATIMPKSTLTTPAQTVTTSISTASIAPAVSAAAYGRAETRSLQQKAELLTIHTNWQYVYNATTKSLTTALKKMNKAMQKEHIDIQGASLQHYLDTLVPPTDFSIAGFNFLSNNTEILQSLLQSARSESTLQTAQDHNHRLLMRNACNSLEIVLSDIYHFKQEFLYEATELTGGITKYFEVLNDS